MPLRPSTPRLPLLDRAALSGMALLGADLRVAPINERQARLLIRHVRVVEDGPPIPGIPQESIYPRLVFGEFSDQGSGSSDVSNWWEPLTGREQSRRAGCLDEFIQLGSRERDDLVAGVLSMARF